MTEFRTNRRPGLLLLVLSMLAVLVCFGVATPRLRGLLVNSSLLAVGTLAIAVPLGTFLAVVVTKTSIAGRRLIERLLIALLFVPLYVQAAAWQASVGPTGWLTARGLHKSWFVEWPGAIWVHGMAAIPWVVLIVGASLRNVPRELEEEALQDAHAWRVVLLVSLRRAISGVLAASLWVAVICFGEITITDLFQIRTFAEEIYTASSLGILGDFPAGASGVENVPLLATYDLWVGTIAVLMLVLAALAAVWSILPSSERTSQTDRWIWQLRGGSFLLAIAPWTLMLLVVALPVVSLIGKAGVEVRRVEEKVVREWSATKAATMVLHSPWEHRRELGWSCAIGGAAAVGATCIGILIAWALRTGRLPVLPTALLLAAGFALPGPLVGVWIIRVMNQPPESIWSSLAWCYDNTILAPIVVQFLRSLPIATLVLWSQLASLPQDVLDSAKSEGAGWWQRLFEIALPQRWPAVMAACCISLIVAFGDLAATLLVAPPGVATLSMRIFGLLHYGAEDRVAALSLALALAIGLLASFVWGIFWRREE